MEVKTQRSLYVGDLDPSITSTDLFNHFSQLGFISSVRLCSDSFSGASLCCGYVNFVYPRHVANALKLMNHTNLKGKQMRIMWCERNPIKRKTATSNLFIKNLDSSIDSARLEAIFSKFGTVNFCKVDEDESGKSKGFGYVQFHKDESAVAAIDALHDTQKQSEEIEIHHLYVKNLSSDLTEDDLKEKFSEFGKVTSAVIMRDGFGGSKGFGFVNFECPEAAKNAMKALDGASLSGGRCLFLVRAQKKAERAKQFREETTKWSASTLFVRNLDPSVDDIILKSHFRPFGFVVLAKVIRYNSGISRGFGFVSYSNPSEATRALAGVHGSILQGEVLSIAKARSREEDERNNASKACQSNPYSPAYPAIKRATLSSSDELSMSERYTWHLLQTCSLQTRREPAMNRCKSLHQCPATANGVQRNLKPVLNRNLSPICCSIVSCIKRGLFSKKAAKKLETKLITKDSDQVEVSMQLAAHLVMLLVILLCQSQKGSQVL